MTILLVSANSDLMIAETENDQPEEVITIEKLYKIFGASRKLRQKALELSLKNYSKEEILKTTKCVVGVRDVNLSVFQGEFFVIMGLSGSGKSTLVRCLNMLSPPTSGTVTVEGQSVTSFDDKQLRELRRRTMAMIFQHYGLLPHRTVIENIILGLEFRRDSVIENQELIDDTLEKVGLTEWITHYPRQCSGGMQQRVGIARAIVQNTPILLMDEPFSGLDPLIRNQMQNEFTRIQSELKKTIIFITHDLEEAMSIGDRIALMQNGEIIQVGKPHEIIYRPVNQYVKDFVQGISPSKVLQIRQVATKIRAHAEATTTLKQIADLFLKSKSTVVYVSDNKKLIGRVTPDILYSRQNDETAGSCAQNIQHLYQKVENKIVDALPSLLSGEVSIPIVNPKGTLTYELLSNQVISLISQNTESKENLHTAIPELDEHQIAQIQAWQEKD